MPPKRKSLRFIGKVLITLNGIAVLLLLLSYLAPFVKPQVFWPFAFMGIAYPLFLFFNVIFVFIWLFRKPSLSLISLFAILIGWTAIDKHFGFGIGQSPSTARDSSALRVMSYNVQMFNNTNTSPSGEGARSEIAKIIRDVSPDILCIQEFQTHSAGQKDMKSQFKEQLDFKYVNFIPVAENNYDAYGIVIFSKYPIFNSGTLDINTNKKVVNRVVYSDINFKGRPLRVYNVHLQSIGFQKEDYEYISHEAPSGQVDMQSTKRIGRRLKSAYIKRNEQVDMLHLHAGKSNIPFIVAGDFNDTPLSYSVNRLSGEMQNAFVEKGRGLGITYNGAFPNFQIDYILASNDFKVLDYQVVRKEYSDHYPIWSDLHLP